MLRWNKILNTVILHHDNKCHTKGCISHVDNVWLIEPKNNLYHWIKIISIVARSEKLLIVDHIIADERLDKQRQSLL